MATSVTSVPAEIADGDGVRAVQRPDVDALDVVEAEGGAIRCVQPVSVPFAEMPNVSASIRSDQAQGVEVGAAFDGVAAVAGDSR